MVERNETQHKVMRSSMIKRSALSISNRRLKVVFILLAVLSLVVWEYFVYYAARHPVPAGSCVSAYGDCAGGPTFWGNVVWGSMGFFVVLVPGWIVTLIAIALSHYMNAHRQAKPALKP